MQSYDGGGEFPSKHPTISLVFFEEHDQELKNALLESLEQFFERLKGELSAQPRFSLWNAQKPESIPAHCQDTVFFPVLEQATGNIILGVTGTGFFDPSLSRYIFSNSSWNGRALLSTYRFRTETNNRCLFLDRLRKQIIKTLAMGCDLSICSNPDCVVSYHRWVEDLDRNRCICDTCRTAFIRSLSEYLKQDDGSYKYRAYV